MKIFRWLCQEKKRERKKVVLYEREMRARNTISRQNSFKRKIQLTLSLSFNFKYSPPNTIKKASQSNSTQMQKRIKRISLFLFDLIIHIWIHRSTINSSSLLSLRRRSERELFLWVNIFLLFYIRIYWVWLSFFLFSHYKLV